MRDEEEFEKHEPWKEAWKEANAQSSNTVPAITLAGLRRGRKPRRYVDELLTLRHQHPFG